MKNKIVSGILAVVLLLTQTKVAVAAGEIPEELHNLYAQSAVLMDADSGRILFGKNEEKVLPMASTTKIMTCIVALEQMEEEQICTVSEYAANQPKVRLGVQQGEQFHLKDLLYSLMLESHNDSAVIIAEEMAGSVEGFAKMMNQKAVRIGCENTYFITPNGLDAKDEVGVHSTTASDLALIMRYCIQISPKCKEFLQITQCRSYEFHDVAEKRVFSCNNHNLFLDMMEGALTGKTGFTNDAGYCYVGVLRQGERTFIVALLACGWPNNKNYKWTDTKKLMKYGLENYEYKNVWKDTGCDEILIENGMLISDIYKSCVYIRPEIVNIQPEITALVSESDDVEVKKIINEKLQAPVKADQKVGKIIYMVNGEVIEEVDIIAGQDVEARNIQIICRYIVKQYFLT